MKRHIVAVYGTLRQGQGNFKRLLTDSNVIFSGGLTKDKFTLRVSGIPFLTKEPTHRVVVDLMKVNDRELECLDRLEGHPHWYKREQVDVVSPSGEKYTAWIYFFPNSTAPFDSRVNDFVKAKNAHARSLANV